MKNTRHHKAGQVWNELNFTDRANWLQTSAAGHTGWQRESWCNLPASIRQMFITHVAAVKAIYAYR